MVQENSRITHEMSTHGELKSPGKEVCYSEDETMKRRLLRKRQLEESEVYNAPETMAAKRRAVKEAAKTTPVPHRITKFAANTMSQAVSPILTDSSLTFDDQIEPSETADTPEQEQENLVEEQGLKLLHAEEKGSNAAESGVDAAQDGAVPVAVQDDAAMVDGVGYSEGKANSQVHLVNKEDGGKQEASVDAVKRKPKAPNNLPLVLLEPRRWAQKSNQGARRSRRRLRRLMMEEKALLSSQLQVA